RPEDVACLIEHFLKKIARERGEKPKTLDCRDPRIMKRFQEHPWPGNVRPLDEVVEDVEREEISNALKQTSGNRTKAAALLKINRRSLLRRLKKYGLASAEDEEALAGDDGD